MNRIIAIHLFAFFLCTHSILAKSTGEKMPSYLENTPDSLLAPSQLNAVEKSPEFIDRSLEKAYQALEQKDIKTAWAAYLSAREVAVALQKPAYQDRCELLKAEIYKVEGLPERAMAIYQFYIGKDTKASLAETRDLLVNTYETYELMGDYARAYQYLLAAEEVKEKMAREKRMEEIDYLRSKFAREQEEKENALLTTQVLYKQNKQQQLYGGIALCLISLCLLAFAFFQKRKYERHLKEEISKQTKALYHSQRELAEFNQRLSQDLKEPLRHIIGTSALASKAVFGNERAMAYLKDIEKSGQQVHKMIEDLSTLQSVDGYAENPPEWIDTEQLLDYISNSGDLQVEGKSLRLEKEDLRPVYGNRSLLYLTFKNLLENGMKYNQHSEVFIKIAYQKANGQHVFRFTDNGIGIAKEYHQKIFQLFKRLHDRNAYAGSGLGLSIVKKMIAKAKGSIALIASEEGRGSTFEVCLPVAAVEETWASKRQMLEHA